MKAAAFYAVTGGVSLAAIAAEAAYSRVRKKGWYDAADTASNLNLGAGNLLAGLVLTIVVIAGYGFLYAHRLADASAQLPSWLSFAIAVLFADFLQYWNHRASHAIGILWAGHVTHHSSEHLNLSTGIRVNWLYRGYAWLLYAPMPLLGFSFEAFVFGITVITTYNLFMHTRLRVPFGPLEWLLVSPESHGLHHASDPRYFGNYGAMLIVWDRIFGTYRERSAEEKRAEAQSFGIGRALGANPMRLNFHYIVDVWVAAREHRRSFFALLFGSTSAVPVVPDEAGGARPRRAGHVQRSMWVGLGAIAVITFAVQGHVTKAGLGPLGVALVGGAVVLVTVFGIALERRGDNHQGTSPDAASRGRAG